MTDFLSEDHLSRYPSPMNLFSLKRCQVCQVEVFNQRPLCGVCFERLRDLQAADRMERGDYVIFSLFSYADEIQELIHRLKFQEQRYLSGVMADFIVRFLNQNQLPVDAVSHIPMHRYKKRVRGFDQAEDLAMETARRLEVPQIHLFERTKRTKSLYKLDRRQRRDVMAGSMKVIGEKPPGYLMIIDDILTTGATISACSEALTEAQIEDYFFLVLAKAIPEG